MEHKIEKYNQIIAVVCAVAGLSIYPIGGLLIVPVLVALIFYKQFTKNELDANAQYGFVTMIWGAAVTVYSVAFMFLPPSTLGLSGDVAWLYRKIIGGVGLAAIAIITVRTIILWLAIYNKKAPKIIYKKNIV